MLGRILLKRQAKVRLVRKSLVLMHVILGALQSDFSPHSGDDHLPHENAGVYLIDCFIVSSTSPAP